MGGDLNVYEGVFLFKSRGNKYKIEYSRSLGRANKSYHKDSKYRDRLVYEYTEELYQWAEPR